jgi:hypothetical protein
MGTGRLRPKKRLSVEVKQLDQSALRSKIVLTYAT